MRMMAIPSAETHESRSLWISICNAAADLPSLIGCGGASYCSPADEAARETINDWIVHGGAFDGVIRLDTAFADSADPQKMREGYHFGNHLLGNDAEYEAAADSIDLRLFRP